MTCLSGDHVDERLAPWAAKARRVTVSNEPFGYCEHAGVVRRDHGKPTVVSQNVHMPEMRSMGIMSMMAMVPMPPRMAVMVVMMMAVVVVMMMPMMVTVRLRKRRNEGQQKADKRE